jgi:hypothetical protein
MFRTVAVIAAAIEISQPRLAEEEKLQYAHVLQEEAIEHDFDPLSGISIIHFESNFNQEAISSNGEDYGLAQIRARYIGACKKDPNPKDAPGSACREVKTKLLDGVENIRVMADLITQNRVFCKKKVGSNHFARWLASYQGRNNARKKQWCKPGDGTYRVIHYRTKLLSELGKQKDLRKELAITTLSKGKTNAPSAPRANQGAASSATRPEPESPTKVPPKPKPAATTKPRKSARGRGRS